MKIHFLLLCAIAAAPTYKAHAQQTTDTSCNLNGSTAYCSSTTTDYGAQQRRAYEQGQQFGSAVGSGIALAMQKHAFHKSVRKFCDANPGETWTYKGANGGASTGRCPSYEEQGASVAHEFMGRHHDFIPEPDNALSMTTYLEDHRLDPLDEKSFERAYKDLKKEAKLKLYAR